MSILTDALPTCIIVKDTEVPINTDFRVSIMYGEIVENEALTDTEIVLQTLAQYITTDYLEKIPQELICVELFEQISKFYQGGKTQEQIEQEKKLESMGNGKRAYSFSLDADRIHAAFYRQYNMDLNEIEYLHWWKFLSLFQGLDDDNDIVKIMGYRTMKIDSKMSKEEQKHYKKLQRKYALPTTKKSREVSQLEQDIINGTFRGLEV